MANHVRVLIATSGRRVLLERTLASLTRCRLPKEYRGMTIVDSGPAGEARDVVEQMPATLAAQYLHYPTGNKSLALNRALSTCEDALIVFTDDDVGVEEGLLEAYANVSRGEAGGVVYGGPVLPEYDQEPAEWLKPFLPASAKGFAMAPGESGSDFDFMHRVAPVSELPAHDDETWHVPAENHRRFLGLNWAAFHSDLRDAGFFDARFGPGAKSGSTGQETTMQDKLVAAGHRRVYVPAAVVHHHVPRTRCTMEWALARAYRDGVQRGMTGERAPTSTLGPLIRCTLGAAVHALHRNPEQRFRPKFEQRYLLGVWRGRWMRLRNPEPRSRIR
jgi:glycosyltransferase involved in cell wall biosynthesis